MSSEISQLLQILVPIVLFLIGGGGIVAYNKSKKQRDIDLFVLKFSKTYSQCFNDSEHDFIDNMNLIRIHNLCKEITQFENDGNSFKGLYTKFWFWYCHSYAESLLVETKLDNFIPIQNFHLKNIVLPDGSKCLDIRDYQINLTKYYNKCSTELYKLKYGYKELFNSIHGHVS